MGFRRFNRQIEVFDISLMAVVTKAMGAFLVIMLLLMPYYQSSPAFEKSAEELQQQIDDLQSRLAEMEKNVGRFKDDPDELKRQLAAMIAQVNEARVRIVALQRQLDQAWSQNRRLEAEVAAVERERDLIAAQKAALERQFAAVNAQKQALDRELAAWQDIDKYKAIKPRYSVLVHARTAADCLAQKGPVRARADESSTINFQIIQESDAFLDAGATLAPLDSTTKSLFALRLTSEVSNRLVGLANRGYGQTAAGHSGKSPFPNELNPAETFTLFTLPGARGFLTAERRPARPDEIDCPVEIRLMVFFETLSQWVRLPDLRHADLPALPPDHSVASGPSAPLPTRPGESFKAKLPVTPLLLAFVDTTVQPGSNRAPLRLPTQEDVQSFKKNSNQDVVIRQVGAN